MSAKTCLLDTSFVIDLLNEAESGVDGPATRTLDTLPAHGVYISPVTVAEVLEGAENPSGTLRFLEQFQRHTLGWAVAQRCAINQARAARRMGENDAWQAALAMVSGHTLIGHDHGFENRLGLNYLDHWKFSKA